MVWYFIGVYIINRTLHCRLEIQNFSSHVEEKFRISARPCNILCLLLIMKYYIEKRNDVNRFFKCPTLGQRFSDKFPTAGEVGGGGKGTLGINRAINNRLKVPVTQKKDPIISLLARSSPLLLLILTFINLNLKSVSANRVWPALLELVLRSMCFFLFRL